MVMFLMALCLSLFGLAVTAMAFGAATRDDQPREPAQPEQRPVLALPMEAPRFFVDTGRPIPAPLLHAAQPRVPIEVLLSQIERHVRLEQAAAESFLDFPTPESLHSRTTSPLVH
jgi:hypothetical protein